MICIYACMICIMQYATTFVCWMFWYAYRTQYISLRMTRFISLQHVSAFRMCWTCLGRRTWSCGIEHIETLLPLLGLLTMGRCRFRNFRVYENCWALSGIDAFRGGSLGHYPRYHTTTQSTCAAEACQDGLVAVGTSDRRRRRQRSVTLEVCMQLQLQSPSQNSRCVGKYCKSWSASDRGSKLYMTLLSRWSQMTCVRFVNRLRKKSHGLHHLMVCGSCNIKGYQLTSFHNVAPASLWLATPGHGLSGICWATTAAGKVVSDSPLWSQKCVMDCSPEIWFEQR